MKRTLTILAAVLALLAVAPASRAVSARTIPVILGYDLDGAAAADNAIFADTNLADGGSYTITNQPDTCRALVATVTDANSSITVGSATIEGTDPNGVFQTATFILTGGSGTKAISGVWCSVTAVYNGTLTGEEAGTDKLRVGTTGTAGVQYPSVLGPRQTGTPITVSNPYGNPLDTFQPIVSTAAGNWFTGPSKIKTTAYGTALTSYTVSSGAFAPVAIGDNLLVNDSSNIPVIVSVTAKADNNNITVDRSISLIGSSGHSYSYRKLRKGSGIYSGWVKVSGAQGINASVNVKQMTGTGGIDVVFECSSGIPDGAAVVQVASANLSAAGSKTMQLAQVPWDECRVGLKWATNDDADATAGAEERIDIYFSILE